MAAVAPLFDEVGATQKAQVFGDSGPGDGKEPGDLSRGATPAAQEVKNGAASGIGKRAEGRFRRICNRSVTHNA